MHGIEHLNTDCTCITLDRDALCRALSTVVDDPRFCSELARSHPHLISSQPIFLSAAHAQAMQSTIAAIEHVVRLPAYQEAIRPRVPEIALTPPGPIGVFMGYDFHLSEAGPKLIEINTNAGGALINAYLLGAQFVCCAEMALAKASAADVARLLETFIASFREEWRRHGAATPLQRIAIVDDEPLQQYLYPEFVLFQRLFERHGIAAVIAAPEELRFDGTALWHGHELIDLVYNRLTDFDLSESRHAVLRDAYRARTVAITPHPWAHAHFADKRNLALLCDEARLASWGVGQSTVAALLEGIPRTVPVLAEAGDALWAKRSGLFFKPCTGYGSKAAYRGDKITKKVWTSILAGHYVAQDIVPPSTRAVVVDGAVHDLKTDLRCYTYDGQIQLIAARLYSGQTTNFRTAGGGFAPVFISGTDAECQCA